jgi:hypothetical protein
MMLSKDETGMGSKTSWPALHLLSYASRCATRGQGTTKRRIGFVRKGVVYELFVTNLPHDAFTAADVLALYLHRGAFEPTLADEDSELDPDRWCSHSAWGQEAWQCIAQWVWNLRLELGHHLKPEPLRTTEFAPALGEQQAGQTPTQGYEPPVIPTGCATSLL